MKLELIGISKSFGSVKANQNVNLRVADREIHALIGENGAGKSTLMKVIYGLQQPDSGQMIWRGKERVFANPAAARSAGIGMVMQHFALFETMTVAENLALYLGIKHRKALLQLSKRAREAADAYGFAIEPEAKVSSLSVGEKQRVEILKCLLQEELQMLILDEPTAVLAPNEVDELLRILQRLAGQGCSILYITHKLHEVKRIAHKATILRGGQVVTQVEPSATSEQRMAALMVGDTLQPSTAPALTVCGDDVLKLRKVSCGNSDGKRLKAIDLTLCGGQITGIAGVAGNGQDLLVDVISGEQTCEHGEIQLDGRDIARMSLALRYQSGLQTVPAERNERGAISSMSLVENLYLKWRLKHRHFWIPWRKVRALTVRVVTEYQVKTDSPDNVAANLSGGNLQKFILGREIAMAPKVLVCYQPTWGVDLHAAAFIRQRLRQLAEQGAAVLVISEDLDELYELCHRLGAIYDGQLSPLEDKARVPLALLGQWMAGAFVSSTAAENKNSVMGGAAG